jgi:hypothetical protein
MSKYDSIIEQVEQIIEKQLDEHLTIDDGYNQLATGGSAFVYAIEGKPNKVLRIDVDPYEEFFEDVVGWNLNNVVKVYASKIAYIKLKENGIKKYKNISITLMERLEKISKQDMTLIGNCIDLDGEPTDYYYELKHNDKFTSKERKMLSDVFKGIKQLRQMDIYLNDLHGGNVMYDPKKKRYKIIDLSNV